MVSRSDQRGITDSGQELSTEPKTHAGHAGDHFGEWMAAKSALDVGVGVFDAFIEGHHPLRQLCDQSGGDLFAGQSHRLGLGGSDRGRGDRGGVAHPGVGQYPGQPRKTALPNGFRALVARQQHHPTSIGAQLSDPLQGGAHRDELLAQPIDRAGTLSDQIRAMSRQHPQFGDQVIIGMQHRQIRTAHPGLIGDHPGVFGVGLGLPAAVDSRGLPHRAPSQIAHRLAGISQHRQQQTRIHSGQIDRPRHLVTQCVDLGHEFTDLVARR